MELQSAHGERNLGIGDWQLWTEAGKLPISTMSLKWLNLNFDKGGAAKKRRGGNSSNNNRETRMKLLKGSCENVDA